MKPKLTVTVGIPVYNEENNIGSMLMSVISQVQQTYVLAAIIVISDGSSDTTDMIVLRMAKTDFRIRLIADGKRMGKQKRLAELYGMNRSRIFIQFDGDTELEGNRVIENLIAPFTDPRVTVVGGDRVAVADNNFIARLVLHKNRIWHRIRTTVPEPDAIINCFSCILAMRDAFAKSIRFDSGITSESQLIYCEVRKQKLLFVFAGDARIYYKLPNNISDFLSQTYRTADESHLLESRYGTLIRNYDRIPFRHRIGILTGFLLNDPVDTLLALIFFRIMTFFRRDPRTIKSNGLWKTVRSTKSGLAQYHRIQSA
jgi:glycosyltransferase involved in cell wall biosynthesis